MTTARSAGRVRRRRLAAVAAGAGVVGLGLSMAVPLAPAGAARRAHGHHHDPAFLQAKTEAHFGSVLTDAHGRVLYGLTNEASGKLACTSSTCLGLWPPVLVGTGTKASAITLGKGVTGSVGFVKRSGSKKQVTFDGYPLYRFAGDHHPGQDSGEGVKADGGIWELLTASSLVPPASSSGG